MASQIYGTGQSPSLQAEWYEALYASSDRRNISKAFCVVSSLNVGRSSGNRKFLTVVAAPSAANATKTVPTGFSLVPPPGPAIPVVAKANVAFASFRAPSAIARATSSLTAPCSEMRRGSTPNILVLASLEYVMYAARKTAEAPGTFVIR